MSRVQHHGIITTIGEPNPLRGWPKGVITDGDSYLVWGETRQGDHTLHLLYEGPLTPGEVRVQLKQLLTEEERLVDYASETDMDDWSANEVAYWLENYR